MKVFSFQLSQIIYVDSFRRKSKANRVAWKLIENLSLQSQIRNSPSRFGKFFWFARIFSAKIRFLLRSTPLRAHDLIANLMQIHEIQCESSFRKRKQSSGFWTQRQHFNTVLCILSNVTFHWTVRWGSKEIPLESSIRQTTTIWCKFRVVFIKISLFSMRLAKNKLQKQERYISFAFAADITIN